MGDLFQYDSKFGRIMGKLADCVTVSLLWIVFCLPGVTAGAATTALYYSAVKFLREDRSTAVKEFWHSFKSNFKQSTIVMLLALFVSLGWGLACLTIYEKFAASLLIVYLVYFIVLAFGIMWLHYIFSYIARFQDTLSTVLKNTLYICLSNFPYSLLVVTLFAMVLFFMAVTLPISLWALLALPAVYAVLVSLILEPIYKKYLPDEPDEET